jgi:uncharacterized protein (TIGR00369 family)
MTSGTWTVTAIERLMTDEIPFNRHLGLRVLALDPGEVKLWLPFRPEFIGDPVRRALHGGVVSMLIDTAGGAAAFISVEEGDRISTVDLVVDYLRPGPPEDIVATARVVRRGNRICLCTVEVAPTESPGDVFALGRAVYNIHHAD